MNWLKNKLKAWLEINSLRDEVNSNYQKLKKMDDALLSDYAKLEAIFNKHTRTDIDLNLGRDGSYIIISGKWRNNDHVEVIRIHPDDFDHVVEYMKKFRRWEGNYRIDAPRQFKGMF